MCADAAKRLDEAAVKRWLLIFSVVIVPTVVLRWWELWALNTRWDTNAYGSAVWTIVGFHTSLLVLDVVDTLGLTLFFFIRQMPVKSFSDTTDNSFYWYFTVAAWVGHLPPAVCRPSNLLAPTGEDRRRAQRCVSAARTRSSCSGAGC